MQSVGFRIEKMRKIWRLSVDDISKKLGITVADYEKLESDKIAADMATAMKLCNLLQISLDYLMTGAESEKDKKSINRPLTKEEAISDRLAEVKKKYSQKNFEKYKKYLYAIYIDPSDKVNAIWLSRENSKEYMRLDDYDFFKELCENGVFDLRHEKGYPKQEGKSTNIDEVLSFEKVFALMKERSITDEKFIEYAVKKDPVKVLNYYYLTDDRINDKAGILKCLDAGGYVVKCVDIKYYDDGEGNSGKNYEFGKDSLATILLREHCQKK